ncbi:hypothetical protein WKH56_08970 [Priestia sp. SB1]|uniref:hypothetical protein n=1 Tax=Priestia sp. SB1 TaxID=3132359 RepID=UPI0031810043
MSTVIAKTKEERMEKIYSGEFEKTLEKLITAFAAEKGTFVLNDFFLSDYTEELRNNILSRVAEVTDNKVNLLDSYKKNETAAYFEDEELKFSIILKQIDKKLKEISEGSLLRPDNMQEFRSKSHWRLLELVQFILKQMSKSTLDLIRFECDPALIKEIKIDKENYFEEKFQPGTTFLYGDISCKRAKLKLVYNHSTQKYNLLNLEDYSLLFESGVDLNLIIDDALLTPCYE